MNLSLKKFLGNGLLVAAVAMVSVPAGAQDLLARQAPIDKKMRAVDSVSIMHMVIDEQLENPAADLYPTWSNTGVSRYSAEMPKEFKIDLRHFCMPTTSRKVTSHFGYRASFGRNHYGTDIKVYVGDTIRAAFSGKVRVVKYEAKGYGNYVVIRHTNGLETLYGHMSKQLVKADQVVKAGDPIGLGGNTGRSTGSHLHFETRLLGQCIDPELMFSFEAQDVKGDYYVYRATGNSHIADAHTLETTGNGDVAVVDATADKAVESTQYQQQRRAERPRTQVHKVKKGETLSSIARKCGVTVDKLCKMNNISRSSKIRPGQILKYS